MARKTAAGQGLSLAPLFAPRSVAILGASDEPSRIGGRPLDYLLRGGFPGRLLPVNPKRLTVQGQPAFASLAAVEGPIDLAIVALPAAAVPQALRDCVRAGVKACVIFSAGFAEAGAEGGALQTELQEIAQAGGLRLVGPNCLGLFSTASRLYATFTSTFEQGLPLPGHLSIVSQSGAFGSHLYYLARRRGLGLNHWITTGNECDVEVAEVLAWLAGDPGTQAILVHVEGVRDGDLFVEGLELARRAGKAVAVMKSGRSAVGAAAVTSHTAALAGEAAVFEGIFRQFGAESVRTAEELIDLAYAARLGRFPKGRRLGLVTISGGVGALMADTAADHGLEVPPLPAAAQEEVKQMLPFAAARNPVDFTAQAFNDMGLIARSFETMLARGGYDAVLAYLTSIPGVAKLAEPLRQALGEANRRHPDCPILLSMLVPPEIRAAYEAEGFAVFEDPSRAVAAIAGLARCGAAFARGPTRLAAAAAPPLTLPAGPLGEMAARGLLAAAGVPLVPAELARDAQAAVAAFAGFGAPVAMKIESPDLAHKTEIGGVLLNLEDPQAVAAGFETLRQRFAASRPEGRWNGVLVSPMVTGGVETIIGVKRDPSFGPVVMLGLGGIFVEVLRDVTFRLAPFDEAEAHRMIGELGAAALLRGARGREPADVNALAAALAQVSRLAAGLGGRIKSLDINPFLVLPDGQGALALDALVVPASAQEGKAA